MTGQTVKHSFYESIINVFIGYIVAVGGQVAVFPMFGIAVTFSENLIIGLWFTAISIVRSFCVRRSFNYWGSK